MPESHPFPEEPLSDEELAAWRRDFYFQGPWQRIFATIDRDRERMAKLAHDLQAELACADDWTDVLAAQKRKLQIDLDHTRDLLDQRDERIVKMRAALERIKIRVHNLVEYDAELCAWVDEALEERT